MTEKKNIEQLRRQLEEARAELQRLITEQGRLDVAEREAAEADHQARMEAARGGATITEVLSSVKSRVLGVRDRRQELPYLVWSARLRVAELERDIATAELPEAEAAVQPAREALREFENEKLREFEEEHRRLAGEHERAFRRAGALDDQRRDAERRLEQLLADGPTV